MCPIIVKYTGATNSRGAKLIASCYLGKVMVSYDYSFHCFENMLFAAIELCKKHYLDHNKINSGGPLDDRTVVFTSTDDMETLAHLRTQIANKLQFVAAE
jgi:hypothetical protein